MSENRKTYSYSGTGPQESITGQNDRAVCVSVSLGVGDNIDLEVATSTDPAADYIPLLKNVVLPIAAFDLPRITSFRLNINTNTSGAIILSYNSTKVI